MQHLRRRVSIAAITLSVGIVGSVGLATPATAASDPAPASQAGAWLGGQATLNGLLPGMMEGEPDIGLTADAGIALAEIGQRAGATKLSNSVAAVVKDFVTFEKWGEPGSIYAGGLAKTLVLAQAVGADTASYGGMNLVEALEGSVLDNGRIQDKPAEWDSTNTFGFAFAAQGLAKAGSSKAGVVTDFLLEQQCAEGWFRLRATDQPCDQTPGATAHPDATALSVIALRDQQGDPEVSAAITKATNWLVSVQQADGAWTGDAFTPAANANTTGLATWALGDSAAGRAGAVWLRKHQARDAGTCLSPLAPSKGAIAYDDGAWDAAQSGGITDNVRDQWRRGSAQAVPGLKFAPAPAGSLSLSVPSGYVRAGSRIAVRAKNIAPHSRACLTGPGLKKGWEAGTSDAGARSFGLTLRTGKHAFRVTDSSGRTVSRSVTALGSKRFKVTKRKARIVRGKTQRIVASGLAPREKVVITLRSKKVRTTRASAGGWVVANIAVGRKLGGATVVVRGEFGSIRYGWTSFKVVRR